MKKIFVAAPFNGATEEIRNKRIEAIGQYCVRLFLNGDAPISPLLMGLCFAGYGNLPTDTATWASYSRALMRGCEEVHVLKIDGWKESTGVGIEIEEAVLYGKPIIYVEI